MHSTLVVQPLSAMPRRKSPKPFSSDCVHSVLVIRQGAACAGAAFTGKDTNDQTQRMVATQIRAVMSDTPSTDRPTYAEVKGAFQCGAAGVVGEKESSAV